MPSLTFAMEGGAAISLSPEQYTVEIQIPEVICAVYVGIYVRVCWQVDAFFLVSVHDGLDGLDRLWLVCGADGRGIGTEEIMVD